MFAIYIAWHLALPLLFFPFTDFCLNAIGLAVFCTLAILVAFLLYLRQMPIKVLKQGNASLLYDFILGRLTLILALPVVATISELCDLLLILIYEVESYEQVAVRFVKMSMQNPLPKFWPFSLSLSSLP